MSATWRELRARAEQQLREYGVVSPESEARWLLEEASGLDAGEWRNESDRLATPQAERLLGDLLDRRRSGEPLQYVIGRWSFRGLDVMVDGRALIPRPETEVVAEVAIEEVVRQGEARGRASGWSGNRTSYVVADLGTGSGVLALALAAELPDALVWATDASEGALALARANLAGAGTIAVRVRLAHGSWFGPLPGELRGELRVVVSNPPYVAERELADLPPEIVDHEPLAALVSGPTGMEAVGVLVREALAWLAPGGALVVEHAPSQAEPAIALAREVGYVEVHTRPDLTGRARVLVARRPA